MTDKAKIAKQFYIAFERLGANVDLLSIVGSYGDTLDDGDVLDLMVQYNLTGVVLTPPGQRH